MSHQSEYNGPELLAMPLDFLSRFIRGFFLWPIVAGISMLITTPGIIWLAEADRHNPRHTALVLTFLVVCIWSPGLAMAICFAQRHQPRPWGPAKWIWRFDPEDLPFPIKPKPHGIEEPKKGDTKPAEPDVPEFYVPDPDWFNDPAPAELHEGEMDR